MSEISATDAARQVSALLDDVEHRRAHYTEVRCGRAVAVLAPVPSGSGADVKQALRDTVPDAAWADDVAAIRDLTR